MKKRLISLLLSVLMITTLLSTLTFTSFAASGFNLKNVAENRDGNGWMWDYANKKLTLFGVDISGSITLPGNSTVELVGYNKISSSIRSEGGSLTVTGNGILNAGGLNAEDGDYDLTVNSGHLILEYGLYGKNITVKGGLIEIYGDRSTSVIHSIDGTFTQKAGMIWVENKGTGNCLESSGMGIRLEGGFLHAVGNCSSTGIFKAAIECSGNELAVEGGVLYVENNNTGYAIQNKADELYIKNGVVCASTKGTTAVAGKITTDGDERYWTSVKPLPSTVGKTVFHNTLTSYNELVLAKGLNLYSSDNQTLDSLYLSNTTTYFENKSVNVKSGSLINYPYAAYHALVISGNPSISGTGTLAVIGSTSFNGSTENMVGLTGTFASYSPYDANLCIGPGVSNDITLGGFYANYILKSGNDYPCVRCAGKFESSLLSYVICSAANGNAIEAKDVKATAAFITAFSKKGNAIDTSKYNESEISTALGTYNLATLDGDHYAIKMSTDPYATSKISLDNSGLKAYAPKYAAIAKQFSINGNSYIVRKADALSGNFFLDGDRTLTKNPVLQVIGQSDLTPRYPTIVKMMDRHVYAPANEVIKLDITVEKNPKQYGDLRYWWEYKLNDTSYSVMGDLSADSFYNFKAIDKEYEETFNCLIWDSIASSRCEVVSDDTTVHFVKHPFTDLEANKWYTSGALFCYKNGYMTGTSDTEFSPNMKLSRAQAVQIFAKIDGVDLNSYKNKNSFTDVPDKWFHNAVEWAFDKGIASGVGEGKFNPNGELTREQLAVMLYAFAKYQNKPTSTTTDISKYSDYSQISNWAKSQMAWAVASELISGTTSTTLAPKVVATRAQMGVIIKKYCEIAPLI